ncbi:hypothetical protein F4803DRAFT_36244 [Xylaria telfairii]|nr:hypothetical protein F4803DRAFT_36244 [Xylaria telfairii]
MQTTVLMCTCVNHPFIRSCYSLKTPNPGPTAKQAHLPHLGFQTSQFPAAVTYVCVSVCLSVCMYVCMYVRLSLCLSLSVCLSLCHSVCLSWSVPLRLFRHSSKSRKSSSPGQVAWNSSQCPAYPSMLLAFFDGYGHASLVD